MQGLKDLVNWPWGPELVGRSDECAALNKLIGDVRHDASRALVLHGEPGIGKTALLDHAAGQATDCRVVRGGGVESEMELPFAGLQRLCAPLLDHLDRLPGVQRAHLTTALGLGDGPAPHRFQVGLAALSLLSEAAQTKPLIVLVDDFHWLDTSSAQALAFVARRLGSESVGLIIAARVIGKDLSDLPGMRISGLSESDAQMLLDVVLHGRVDSRIRRQLITETGGNPLALIELPRGLTPTELAGGFGLPGAVPLSGTIEEHFARRANELPETTRRLLLVAATDPSGDPALLWRAAGWLRIRPEALDPAISRGLVEVGTTIRFRHPLIRSAVYRSASPPARQQAHQAVAQALDEELDPDRRAWHRSQAVSGPDEAVAVALERSASRALTRGGLAAAAAFMLRAATLTLDPARRTARALAAAAVHIDAGALEPVPDLLSMAEAGPLNEFQRAHIDLIRARAGFVANRGSDIPPLLLSAAKRLASFDVLLSRATYLDAVAASTYLNAGAARPGDRHQRPAEHMASVARAARAAPPAPVPRPVDLLLDGTITAFDRGYAAGLPTLKKAVSGYGEGMSPESELRWLWFATTTAMRIWDDDSWYALSKRHIQIARDLGSLKELPRALDLHTLFCVFAGDLATAARLTDEAQAIDGALGTSLAPYGALAVAAFRGDAPSRTTDVPRSGDRSAKPDETTPTSAAEWASAVRHNAFGNYAEALSAAQRSISFDLGPAALLWPHVELIEAAVRAGEPAVAADVYRRVAGVTTASGSGWARGIQDRSLALLSEGDEAERLYRESIACLEGTRLRVDLARAHLLYGEWLRRERRHIEARRPLQVAHATFESMGVGAFAERARRELNAAGGGLRRRVDARRSEQLTAQESQIARMAREGLTNPEIAARLFLSTHTVQYHLRKVFVKLGVTSRSQLNLALPKAL
ncbi:ATP-binding protein [Actinoplanes sp. CA-131856]